MEAGPPGEGALAAPPAGADEPNMPPVGAAGAPYSPPGDGEGIDTGVIDVPYPPPVGRAVLPNPTPRGVPESSSDVSGISGIADAEGALSATFVPAAVYPANK